MLYRVTRAVVELIRTSGEAGFLSLPIRKEKRYRRGVTKVDADGENVSGWMPCEGCPSRYRLR